MTNEFGLHRTQKQKMNAALLTSVSILQLTNIQLAQYIYNLMNSNPVIMLDSDPPMPDAAHQTEFEFADEDYIFRRKNNNEDYSKDQLINNQPQRSSEIEELRMQVYMLHLPKDTEIIVEYLLQLLDENGFLRDSDESIAAALNVPVSCVSRAVGILRSLEPVGIGARDLKDCLMMQLHAMDEDDPLAEAIVESCLSELSQRKYQLIAKKLGAAEQEVRRACDIIRKLNPKPLNGLGDGQDAGIIVPDMHIVRDDDHFRCIMNDWFVPKIQIDDYYLRMMKKGGLDEAASEYISDCYTQANEISRYVSYRKSTLQQVMELVIDIQHDFFMYGEGHRVAMQNRQIAERLNLHESTISRAVNGKYFQCFWGVFPLKDLFSHSLPAADKTERVDYDHIITRIRELIQNEPPGTALNDQKIADLLSEENIKISRRTVAKYRQQLNIPNADQRNARKRDEMLSYS